MILFWLRRPAEQFWSINADGLSEPQNLKIGHPPDSGLNFGKRVAAQIPAQYIQFRHELGLGEAFFLA